MHYLFYDFAMIEPFSVFIFVPSDRSLLNAAGDSTFLYLCGSLFLSQKEYGRKNISIEQFLYVSECSYLHCL